jgi:DNA-binding transcriptional regulator YhcF (GntR family)
MPGASLLSDLSAALDRSLPVPLSVQLKGLIEYGIACGELPPGTRLPSVRELAEAGGIAPMTAVGVYKELQQAGLIMARQGAGTYVADGAAATGGPALLRVQAHLDAALAEAEAAGIAPAEVASLLSARIGRSRAREARPVRLVMVGVFEDATRAYAQEIARQLRAGDTIEPVTFAALREPGTAVPPADIYVTLANRKAEAEAIIGARAPVTSVSFMPAEATRALLAGLDPLARVGLVSVFPEFLALMKPGVLRFAPHVSSVEAIVLDDPGLPAFLHKVDVIVYATGAERALALAPPGLRSIEYRHVPDPHAVQASLLPLVETIRSGAPAPGQSEEEIR